MHVSIRLKGNIGVSKNAQSNPAEEGKVVRTTRGNDVVDCIIEDRDWSCRYVRTNTLSTR